MKTEIKNLLEEDKKPVGVVGSPSSSFEAVVDIRDVSENSKLLGELTGFCAKEGENEVFVLGQIAKIETKNRWHEEPSFKGIIKRHGQLPHLSGTADNRIAKINIQSSFILSEETAKAHKLANSPSTGISVNRISNGIMETLMKGEKGLVCLGTAYDTSVSVPFRFNHFGDPKDGGGGEAYHIGVFGRTGSGKTTVAANMILGYAQHHENMSILIIDPQGQFYEDNNVLPNQKFKEKIEERGMTYRKYRMPKNVILPPNAQLFGELLLNYGFIKSTFQILTEDKQREMRDAIVRYIESRISHKGKIWEDPKKLHNDTLEYFLNRSNNEREPLKKVYSTKARIAEIKENIEDALQNGDNNPDLDIWGKICGLFSGKDQEKVRLEALVKDIVDKPGNVIILNISGRGASQGMDGLETFYVKLIEDKIREAGAKRYSKGERSNCLVVMDEAHRYISTSYHETEVKELTNSITDSVRTTRKYGIGYMFITQTIESLHAEIRKQFRIFAFGYGLTSKDEFRHVSDIINDEAGAKFYRSFIDPASNGKYPFMFYGPISPLSFTGTPLFLEMNGVLSDFPANTPPK